MKQVVLLCLVLVSGNGLRAQQRVAVGAREAVRTPLSPQELFKGVCPSVFTVQVLDGAKGPAIAIGSGVSVGPDEVVTNTHVIAAGGIYKVSQGDKALDARVAWVDPDHDLALLRVAGLRAHAASLRSSPPVAVGERVYAIGAPEGLELTLSEGMVSGLREYQMGHVIQTSAPISRGSSGGGLFDQEGQLVGITSFGLVEGQNLNFALPAEWVEACPKHVARNGPAEPLPKQYKQAFTQAGIDTLGLSTMKEVATTHGVDVSRDALAEGTSSAVGWLVINCAMDSSGPDCIDNWPAWQQAAMYMLQLRQEIRAARPYESPSANQRNIPDFVFQNVRLYGDHASTTWSELTDIYCRERPGGLYTDLEGKIRACPTSR